MTVTDKASIADIIAAFPYTSLKKIENQPTFSTLLHMQEQLAENAQSVPSPRSPIGHAGLVLPPAIYLQYSPTPWQPVNNGVDPGYIPQFPQGLLTPQQLKQYELLHQGRKAEYDRMKNVDTALKKQIEDAINDTYLQGAKIGTLGFGSRTTMDIMGILFRDFGQITAPEKEANDAAMKKPYNVNEPIETMFHQIEQGQKKAVAAMMPYSPQQLIQIGEIQILQTNAYPTEFAQWRKLLPQQKTWPNFKTFFLDAARARNEMLATTRDAGFSANATTEDATTEIGLAASHFAQASNAAQQSFLGLQNNNAMLNDEVSSLHSQNSSLTANLQALQAQINVLQAQQANAVPQPPVPVAMAATQQNTYAPPQQQQPPPPAYPTQGTPTFVPAQQYYPGRSRGRGRSRGHNNNYNNNYNNNATPPTQQWNQQQQQQNWSPTFQQGGNTRARPPYSNTTKYYHNLNYCWSHGHDVKDWHTSATCCAPKQEHQYHATKQNTMGGSNKAQHKTVMPGPQYANAGY